MQTQNVPALASSPYHQVDTSAIDPHKLKRKIDVRLLPWLTSRTFSTKAISSAKRQKNLPRLEGLFMKKAH